MQHKNYVYIADISCNVFDITMPDIIEDLEYKSNTTVKSRRHICHVSNLTSRQKQRLLVEEKCSVQHFLKERSCFDHRQFAVDWFAFDRFAFDRLAVNCFAFDRIAVDLFLSYAF